jgi:hypothetical protein
MTVTPLRGRTALLGMNATTSHTRPKQRVSPIQGTTLRGGCGFSLEGLYPTVTRPVGFIANPRIGGVCLNSGRSRATSHIAASLYSKSAFPVVRARARRGCDQ